jgi:transposase
LGGSSAEISCRDNWFALGSTCGSFDEKDFVGSAEFTNGKFLDEWTGRVMRSRLEPMKKIARSIRTHRPLILNWFRARGLVSSGAVEGLNNKVKLVTRKSYGFRTATVAKLALLHNLGHLPEPKRTDRFC